MEAILIVNPKSGHYNTKKISQLIYKLKSNNINVKEYKLGETENIKDIINKIKYEEYQILLLACGDGTINTACNALLDRNDYNKFKIGIIPFGTANVLANELKTNKINNSIKAIINGKTKKVCIGELYSKGQFKKYFILMASAGVDSMAVYNIDLKIKKFFGKFAYIISFLKILIKRNFKEIKTNIDGKIYKNFLTCASIGKYYGGKIAITNGDISENNFKVIILKKFSILSILKYLFVKKSKNIEVITTNDLKIESKYDKYPLQIDGDYYCNLPVEIKIVDKYLNMFYNI